MPRRSSATISPWVGVPLWLVILAVGLVEAYRFVPIPITPLMVARMMDGYGWHKEWVPLRRITASVPYAVIAAEDNLFCQHNGFDWKSMQNAYDDWQAAQIMGDDDARMRGASTISQQTAKNVFLWTNPAILRKPFEAPLTIAIEWMWGKPRIMEAYLNVVEWGPGIYGIGAASRYYFHTTPAKLSRRQAALLAAVLPSPLKWSPVRPGPYVAERASRIEGRVYKLGYLLDCVRPRVRR